MRGPITARMAKKKDEIGQSPGSYSPPSWRGTLVMLGVIVVLLALVGYAFLSIAQPLPPQINVPGGVLRF
jgi:hypothetical protein